MPHHGQTFYNTRLPLPSTDHIFKQDRFRASVARSASAREAEGLGHSSLRRRMLLTGSTMKKSKVTTPSRIRGITLSLFDETEIVRGSVVHIYNPDKPYSAASHHIPIPHAINDTRMGVIEHGLVCGTCGGDPNSCPGHFGHMMLNVAIFHPAYMKMALSVLRCVCWTCASVLNPGLQPPEEQILETMFGPKDLRRLMWISKRRPPHACPHCEMPQPNYERASGTRVIWTWNLKRVLACGDIPSDVLYEMRKPFTAARARMIFEAIDEASLEWLGLNPKYAHPKNFIVRALPVPPPCVRPSVVKIEGSKMRGQDDLTSILMNVCKRISQARSTFFDERTSARRMYEFGIVPEECSADVLRRACKPPSKAARKEDLKLFRERKAEEVVAKRSHGGSFPPVPPLASTDSLPPLSPAAFPLAVVPDIIPMISMPFEENRVDSAIAITRPHMTPATARLSSRPDLRLCEYLQSKNSKLLAFVELHLTVHLSTDGKDTTIMRQRSGAQKKTIIKRLKAKEGRMRGNIMGKRVFGSGRAVISPCQSLDVDELGVPQSMASVLTYGKVMVNDSTIERLRKCVRIGALRVNGANMVVKGHTGTRIYLEYAIDREKIASELCTGDMVERYIQDGDLIIFNRQPSLHRMSMMAHRVRIMDSSTLRFNSAAAKPYNADFDGDEMNIHVPKGIRAQAEAKELLSITRNMVSPASNAMTLGIVQDGIVAAYLFTRPTTFLTRAQVQRLMSVIKYPVEGKDITSITCTPSTPSGNKRLWSGSEVMSMLLPQWLDVGGKDSLVSKQGELVRVRRDKDDGLTKAMMGGSSNGIVHRICVDGTFELGMRFMSDAQRVLHAWMAEAGFTTGLHDLVMRQDVRDRVRFILTHIMSLVDRASCVLFTKTEGGTRYVQSETEQRVRAMVSNVVEEATQVGLGYLSKEHDSGGRLSRNGLWDMIVSGSKGSSANAFQMVIAVGTQIISGQRIGIDPHTRRTLSCFPHGTRTAASRGLVTHSYVDGLLPHEFYMHNMGGREGLVHTAIKTAETGYLQRRLVKAMEDLIGMADGSVRDGELRVVQYLYGGDGMDPTRLQRAPADHFVNLPAAELHASEGAEFASCFLRVRDKLRAVMNVKAASAEFLLPCDPGRVVRGAMKPLRESVLRIFRSRFFGEGGGGGGGGEGGLDSLSPLPSVYEILTEYFSRRHLPLTLALLWSVRPSCGLSRSHILEACVVVAAIYDRSRMAAGDPCGIISAQSIGEPSTQMTLNSPHHSGRVGSRVTMGVPRLREIIDRRKEGQIETPLMIIPVVANTQEMAERVMRMVRRVRLRDVIHSSFVAKDPVLDHPHPVSNMTKDVAWMEDLCMAHGGVREHSMLSQWLQVAGTPIIASPFVIRFSMNRETMIEMGIAPVTMAKAIEKLFVSMSVGAIVLHSPRAAKQWVIRVRLVSPNDIGTQWYHETQQAHVLILRKACANQAHLVDWATAGKAEYTEVDTATDQVVVRERWVIQASGSSLASMSRIKELDWTRAHSNDISMVNRVLGLEAANVLYYEQMLSVLTNDGSYIDPRHIQLFADAVTYYGYTMPCRRHGVLRKKTGWAHRASFEEMVSVLLVGAARGEREDLVSPAGAVMTGQMGAFGSGWVGIIDDPSVGSRYNDIETRITTREVSIFQDDEQVQLGNATRFMDARTGTMMTRPVEILRKNHLERNRSHRDRGDRGDQTPTHSLATPSLATPSLATPSLATPIPVQAPYHRYTVSGAIASTTYEGYAGIDYLDDSHVKPKSNFVTFGIRATKQLRAAHHHHHHQPPAATAELTSAELLRAVEITILGKVGTLKIMRGDRDVFPRSGGGERKE